MRYSLNAVKNENVANKKERKSNFRLFGKTAFVLNDSITILYLFMLQIVIIWIKGKSEALLC